ncbi:SapC family protein [Thiomicrorhabdus indica]|uniref:SapC family protein n=1 Tax=Thiomicrorhabdus indica TaxID=2267253 RepID=UPI00102DB987|nr:SapC family protein [Thiomicrorhabdus indica]
MSESVPSSPFIALSSKLHNGYGYAPVKPFEFAQSSNFIELNSAEVAKLIGLMPMLFQVIRSEGSTMIRFGLASGLGEENCLVHPVNGKFLLPYVPAALRAYPFRLIKAKAQGEDKPQEMLAVFQAEVDKAFAKGQGEAILADGKLTEKGKGVMTFLDQLNQRVAVDQKALHSVLESGILIPMNIQVKLSEDSEQTQTVRPDLFRVDEGKLRELSAETLQTLQRTGAMGFIYAHLLSMDKFQNLQKAVEVHSKLKQQANANEVDLEKMFDDDDSDVLKF